MNRRHFLGALGAPAGGVWLAATRRGRAAPLLSAAGESPTPSGARAEWSVVRRQARVFGNAASLIVHHDLHHAGRAAAAQALDAALAELHTVESVMSLYQPESELCRLNRDGVLAHPHPYLVEVLRLAATISARSHGAFDVTVQPLWELYAAAKQAGRVPGADEMEAARARVDWRQVEVEPDRVRLKRPGVAVTLNAIAQGFAADRVLAVLRERGLARALVNAGELGALGTRGNGQPWTVGIQHPRRPDAYAALVALTDRCLATSGDYATRFGPDYLRHHIFDPGTGQSPPALASVSVAARSGAEADALATAVFVLGPERGAALLGEFPGAEAYLILKDGLTRKTAGFPEVEPDTGRTMEQPDDETRKRT